MLATYELTASGHFQNRLEIVHDTLLITLLAALHCLASTRKH